MHAAESSSRVFALNAALRLQLPSLTTVGCGACVVLPSCCFLSFSPGRRDICGCVRGVFGFLVRIHAPHPNQLWLRGQK